MLQNPGTPLQKKEQKEKHKGRKKKYKNRIAVDVKVNS